MPPGAGPWGSTPPAWGAPPGPAAKRTDGVAIAALVVGLLSVVTFFAFLPAAAAIVLAIIAAFRLRRAAGARKGQGLAISGAVLACLSIIAGVATWVAVAHSGVLSGNLVSYTNLETGDCINMPRGVVRLYHRYSCEHPHDREVTGIVIDHSPDGSPYPGTQALSVEGRTQCQAVSGAYLGAAVTRGQYQATFLYPKQLSWDTGERRLVCLVGNLDRSKLTASLH